MYSNYKIYLYFFPVFATLAYEPFNQTYLFFAYLFGLVELLKNTTSFKNHIKKSLLFLYISLFFQNCWISKSFIVFKMPTIFGIASLFLTPMLLILPYIPIIFTYFLKNKYNLFVFGVCFSLFLSEVLSANFLFTGYTWNLAGYIWDFNTLQCVRFFGIYSLSFFTYLFFASMYCNLKKTSIILLAAFVIIYTDGIYQNQKITKFSDKTVRVLNTKTNQSAKWNILEYKNNLNNFLKTNKFTSKFKQIDLIVWPETTIITDFDRFPNFKEYIVNNLNKNQVLVSGIIKIDNDTTFYNSAVILNSNKIIDYYHKRILVPFGEYIPFRKILMLPNVLESGNDYSYSDQLKTYSINGLKFSIAICFEIAFSSLYKKRPDFLINITNDAWFEKTAQPYQHLKITRIRAIEHGLPIIRSVNKGASCVIDPKGKIINYDINNLNYFDSFIPKACKSTVYSKIIKNLNKYF